MMPISDTFECTMLGLEAGLHVHHIAEFDLRTCSINDSAMAVLADRAFADFEHIPVRDDAGHIVGVLNRSAQAIVGNASETMQQLDESLLVAAEAPLMSFVRLAGTVPYKLVLNENGIRGIVTRSDLLKLPVRLVAFAFVTHLEALMADVIRTRNQQGDESWLEFLSEGRRKKVTEKRDTLKGSRMELDLLEFTEFCDKRQIVKKISSLGRDFIDETEDLEKLRDQIAHAATFISSDKDAREFALKIQNAEKWMAKLQELVNQKDRM
jgi:CBS domain-containing protein